MVFGYLVKLVKNSLLPGKIEGFFCFRMLRMAKAEMRTY